MRGAQPNLTYPVSVMYVYVEGHDVCGRRKIKVFLPQMDMGMNGNLPHPTPKNRDAFEFEWAWFKWYKWSRFKREIP